MNLLVTGGAGYIGAHFVNKAKDSGHVLHVVDSFRESDKNIIKAPNVFYYKVDLRDYEALQKVFENNHIDVVIHFAALASVPDSVVHPLKYYDNNLVGGINLLRAMKEYDISKIIFSSSAAVFGEPKTEIIDEDHVKEPTNPYGRSKLMFEQILQDCFRAYGLSSILFRYFCAAGVANEAGLGEYHNPETHVIPSLIETILGRREMFSVFGNDYPTADGSPIRDFIHVNDVSDAHLLALAKLNSEKPLCEAYNLGANTGYSVFELIDYVEKLAGKKLNYKISLRRAGDPSKLIADNAKAKKELDWQPKDSTSEEMVGSAFTFFKEKK